MKILLANPPCRIDLENGKERFFVRAGSRWPFSIIKKKDQKTSYVPFPFYLAYSAALLEKSGHEVFAIDAIPLNLTKEEFIKKTREINPDIILFETSTPTFNYDIELINELKDFVIVLAGPHVTTFPKESLEKCENIDYVMIKEYELNFDKLVNKLSKNEDISKVEGIGFRKNGEIIVNDTGLTDLSKLPIPARKFFPVHLYKEGICQLNPAIQMHASRGCPFRCNFCLWNQVMYGNGKYRTFPLEHLFKEIEDAIERYNIKGIYFDDDTFTGSKQFVLDFCKEMKKRNLGIQWTIMGDAMITDEEMINAMADSGCVGMKFGVESGNKDVLKKIGKPIDFDKIKKVSRLLTKKGIKAHATFTFGLSGESKETMMQTMKLAEELDVDSVQFSITTPFPGTRYYEELDEKGLLLTKDWNEYDGACSSVVKDNGLSHKDIEEFYNNASKTWLRHKLKDPKWVWRQIKNLNMLRKGEGNKIIFERFKRGIEIISK
jgi:anaerobic magnesium-protoporphyrin IX monomethyl ester cyclase